MIVALLLTAEALALVPYDVQVRPVAYTDPRGYLGFEATDGSTPEARALSFEIDFDDISIVGPTKLTVQQVVVTWRGTAGIASSVRIWRDADGDQTWRPDADTLLATVPITGGRATWAPSAETLAEGERRTWHVTAVLDGAVDGCGEIRAEIAASADVKLTDNDALVYEPSPAGAFPVASTSAADADVVEAGIDAAVPIHPTSTVAGYAMQAGFALTHCDGTAVSTLSAPADVDVIEGGSAVDAVALPTVAPFEIAWTVPPDAVGPIVLELGPGAVEVAGARGTRIVGPPEALATYPVYVLANTRPRRLDDRSPSHAGPAGGVVDVVIDVRDDNGVAVAGDVVTFDVVGDLSPPGALTAGTATTDGAGRATVGFTLSETAGVNRVAASVPDDAVEVEISGYSTDLDPERSSLIALPAFAIADGIDVVAVEVVARDPNDNPIPGVPVVLTSSGGQLRVETGSTDADGRFVTELTATAVQTITIEATLGPIGLGPVEVGFRGVPTTALWGDPWPNPVAAGGTLHVPFTAGADGELRLSVRDLTGAEAGVLVEGGFERGYHEATWTADAPAGGYVVRLEADGVLVDEAVIAIEAPRACDSSTGGALTLGALAAALILGRRRGTALGGAIGLALLGADAQAGSLPTEAAGGDARTQALGGAAVASHEIGLGIAQNPASLETATAPLAALGWADRPTGLQQLELLAAAPLGRFSVGLGARGGFGPTLMTTDDDGAPVGEEPLGTRSVGALAAWTPAPALSIGAGLRGAEVRVGGERLAGAALVDLGVIARPNVPGLQLGAAVLGLLADGGPDARAGFAFALDDELLPPSAPDVLLAAQAGFGGLGASVGAGVEVVPLPLLALRGGFVLDDAGRRATVGLGLRPGPARLDYALSAGEELQHGITVTVAGQTQRERASVALRARRDEAREAALAEAVERAKEQARATTTGELASAQISRVEVRLAAAELDASGRLRPEQILAGARSAIAEGRNDDAWMLAVDAELVLAEEIARVREDQLLGEADAARARAERAEATVRADRAAAAERAEAEQAEAEQAEAERAEADRATAARAAAGPAEAGQTEAGGAEAARAAAGGAEAGRAGAAAGVATAGATGGGADAGTASAADGAGAASPEAAQDLLRAGLDAYRQGLFAVAAARWKEARTLDPTLPGIDGYIANAEAKHATLDELKRKQRR